VDGIVVEGGRVLLVKRAREPFRGRWALPGGFLERNEDVWQAVRREVLEETGAKVEPLFAVGVFSSPQRDPRGVVSVAIACRLLEEVKGPSQEGGEVEGVAWFPLEEVLAGKVKLAFDHREMLERYAQLVAGGRRA